MKKLNQKGVTLIALVIMIIVLLILAAVATYSGREVIESSKLTAFTTEMKIMQTNVNELYEKLKSGEINQEEIGKSVDENAEVQAQANEVLVDILEIEDTKNYRYIDEETLNNLKIEGLKQEFFINIEERKVVSYEGLNYKGNMYYTLEQLPDSVYNVDYDPNQADPPTFDVSYQVIENTKYRVNVSNIQYEGYIGKWYIQYQKDGQENWNTTEDMSLVISEDGDYNIKIINGDVSSEIETIHLGYIQEGLVLHYDGINNTGEGDYKHSNTTTTWKNLAAETSEFDGILKNFTGSSWKSDGLIFDGVDDWVSIGEMNYQEITLEVVLSFDNMPNTTVGILGNVEGGGYEIGYSGSGKNLYGSFFIAEDNAYSALSISNGLEQGKRYFSSASYEGKTINLFVDNEHEEKSKTGTIGKPKNNTIMILGANPNGDLTNSNFFEGIIYSARIYNRALSNEEVKNNYEIDKVRFKLQ